MQGCRKAPLFHVGGASPTGRLYTDRREGPADQEKPMRKGRMGKEQNDSCKQNL